MAFLGRIKEQEVLVSKKKKCSWLKYWDVYANTNNSQPVLSYSCFPHGISLFICGVRQEFMNTLEPLTIFFGYFAEHFNQYFYSICANKKTSCVQIDPNISEKVCSLK